jgi:hypothetical protein
VQQHCTCTSRGAARRKQRRGGRRTRGAIGVCGGSALARPEATHEPRIADSALISAFSVFLPQQRSSFAATACGRAMPPSGAGPPAARPSGHHDHDGLSRAAPRAARALVATLPPRRPAPRALVTDSRLSCAAPPCAAPQRRRACAQPCPPRPAVCAPARAARATTAKTHGRTARATCRCWRRPRRHRRRAAAAPSPASSPSPRSHRRWRRRPRRSRSRKVREARHSHTRRRAPTPFCGRNHPGAARLLSCARLLLWRLTRLRPVSLLRAQRTSVLNTAAWCPPRRSRPPRHGLAHAPHGSGSQTLIARKKC